MNRPAFRRMLSVDRSALTTTLLWLALLVAVGADAGIAGTVGFRTAPPPPSDLSRLLDDGSAGTGERRLFGQKAPDQLDVVVLMCDFSDSLLFGRFGEVPGDFPPPMQSEFLYSAHDSVYFAHLLDDVARYFDSTSGGRFSLNVTVEGTVANLPHPMAWYGNHPEFGEQKVRLVADVVAALDDEVDFRLYDTVMVIHAGAGEETDILRDSPEQIYSSYLSPEDFEDALEEEILEDPWIATDDLVGDGHAIVQHVLLLPETEYQDPAGGAGGYFGSMGVYCFEVGLRLGMLSLSDFTPSGNPDSQGIGQFGLMGYGLFAAGGLIPAEPCAFNKALMGWLDPYDVDPDADGTYTLYPSEHPAADSTLARIPIGPSEYWLVEYRLQDPDGNRIFSFGDDINGNNIPDFTRIDDSSFSPWAADGSILATFDPDLHLKETLSGGEWDFFMSDNTARASGVKGAGSGLYIWHVDEGVIARALDSESNVFNADPDRKSVDLEEADGIQDLDSRRPSPWMLGGDDDSYRGEDFDLFGPDTEPDSRSAGGAWTGVTLEVLSDVVVDSSVVDPDVPWPVLRYAESLRFRCRRDDPEPTSPMPVASLDLPGIDLRGSHLMAVDLDRPVDGTLEIVAVDAEGRVFIWNHDLTPYGGSVDAPGHVTTGTDQAGSPVTWTGTAAVGDVDQDGAPEVVVNSSSGTYIFNADGTEIRDGDFDPDSHGLAAPVSGILTARSGTPAVVPAAFAGEAVSGSLLVATLNRQGFQEEPVSSYFYELYDGAGDAVVDLPGDPRGFPGLGDLPGPLLWNNSFIALGFDGTNGYLSSPGAIVGEGLSATFEGRTAPWPPLVLDDGIIVPMADGGCLFVGPDGSTSWDSAFPVRSPMGPGPVYGTDGGFMMTGRYGAPEMSWPSVPSHPVRFAADGRGAAPLVWRDGDQVMTLFTSLDGRLYLVDSRGDVSPGWPLAGPGEAAATPLALDLDGVPGLEIVAVGTMPRLAGHDPGEDDDHALMSRLVAWTVPGTESADELWPMWGGAPDRMHSAREFERPVGSGGLVDEASVSLYPTPTDGDRMYARVVLSRDGSLEVMLYNLEGEEVARSEVANAVAGEPAEAVLDVAHAASGTYLCRIVARGGGERSVVVRPAAIVR